MADRLPNNHGLLEYFPEDLPAHELVVKISDADILFETIKSLHADIIDQGRKVQIAASGESKYGAMGYGEYIDWVLNKLEESK